MKLLRILLAALFVSSFLLSLSCSDRCKTQNDCRLGMHCDVELSQCVGCLENSQCGRDEFCCHGQCKAMSQINDLCGCSPRLDQKWGWECQSKYAMHEYGVNGPMCLAGGVAPTADTASQADCGCTLAEEDRCGDASDGLRNLCVDSKCVMQDSEHCGASREACTALKGGTHCLPPKLGKYGFCGCKASDPAGCQTPVNGHIVANNCSGEECKCGASPACNIANNSKPDCCDNECRDFSSDPKHCGSCNNSCGAGRCFMGQCECFDPSECQTQETNQCVATNIPRFRGNLCACSQYTKKGTSQFLPCPKGSYCCDKPKGVNGCCSKSCDEAQASDCKRVEE